MSETPTMSRRHALAFFVVIIVAVVVGTLMLLRDREDAPPHEPTLTLQEGRTPIEGMPGHPGAPAATGEERRLSLEQREALIAALKPHAGREVNLGMVAGDNASLRLVGDVKLALDAAEWNTLRLIDIGFSIPVKGFVVFTAPQPDREEAATAAALEVALKAAGLPVERHTDANKPVPGAILLIGDTPL